MDPRKNQLQIGYSSRLFSNGLEKIIDGFDNFNVVNCLPMGEKLRNSLETTNSPDFLILEFDYPSKSDVEFIKKCIKSFTTMKILLISHLSNRTITLELIESGVLGYLLKSCSWEDVLLALNKMSENTPYFCSKITKTLFNNSDSNQGIAGHNLTDREIEILTLLVQNHSNRCISKELNISENTVKTHRRNIQKKFGVTNLFGMVRYACRENLIDFGCAEFCTSCPHLN